MPPPRDDQYISLSPTESPVEEADMESGAVAPPALQVECQASRKGLTRLPADTPRTPGPQSVNFQQFCDRLRTDLPGDSHGRGSFDTSVFFFFSCIAVLVRDIVGQQLEGVKKEIKFPRKQKPTKTNTPTKPHQPNKVLIPVHGLSQGTLVPDSVILHL